MKARRKPVKPQQGSALAEIDGRVNALEEAIRKHDSRLQKLEVVRVPSPTTTERDLSDEMTCMKDGQPPETE